MLSDLPLARPDSRLDRDAATRETPRLLRAAREDPTARFVLTTSRRIALAAQPGARAALDLRARAAARTLTAPLGAVERWDGDLHLGPEGVREAPDSNPDAPQPPPGSPEPVGGLAYLGRVAGAPRFAVLLPDDRAERFTELGVRWASLRDVATSLDASETDMATTATALAAWHASHPRCPRCGARTRAVLGGWVRLCPVDGSQHFPRTDPAVIMAITDADDRVLLGHARQFPERRYSCLAGFVESGEPAEAAVRREVREEAGVEVGDVEYLGSQPWPFPRSLMLGFRGRTRDPRPAPVADGEEMGDVRFFSREELRRAIVAGEVELPMGASIARAILTDWYGGPLPERA